MHQVVYTTLEMAPHHGMTGVLLGSIPSDHRSQPEPGEFRNGRCTDGPNGGRVCLTSLVVPIAHSFPKTKRGPNPTAGIPTCTILRYYQREAEEYDREFMKRYDDDLNTTLVFVSAARHPNTRLLTRTAGWSIFRCGLRIHHRCPF